jgi:hypothetical protein
MPIFGIVCHGRDEILVAHPHGGFVLAEFGPRDTAKGTSRWWSSPARTSSDLDPRRLGQPHRAVARRGSALVRSRRKSPVMSIVGVGQRGARHAAAKAHVLELAAQLAQTRFYVAKSVPVSQLGKGHRQILVPAREASWPCITGVPFHSTQRRNSRSGSRRTLSLNAGRRPLDNSPPPIGIKTNVLQLWGRDSIVGHPDVGPLHHEKALSRRPAVLQP